GATLGACGSTDTQACTFGCATAGGAHCGVMQPSLPVTAADLATAGVADLDVKSDGFVDTDTGAIDGVRAANGSPGTREQKSGITYQLVGNVGVFVVKSLKIETGATLKLRGTAAAAIVATQTMTIVGVIDARGYDSSGTLCAGNVAGPGGSPGALGIDSGNGTARGAGGGKGVAGFTSGSVAGPGGGGYGGAGGGGGGYLAGGGAIVPFPGPIAGGFGGGASGTEGPPQGSAGEPGGGGGGAVQLVAGVSIAIGGGANPGGLNAGGCGGKGATMGQAGSGAGSGGTILVQAPTISIATNGVLAVNGGGGATGGKSTLGENGKLSPSVAIGVGAAGGYGKGGDGSSALSIAGASGGDGTSGNKGGGGGGGAGRIRLENVSGSVTPDNGGIVSPQIGVEVDGGVWPTTVGALLTK
ncbi:MAG: hypothetical protein ABI205_01120, partial [Gemmatimonadaceae bacterium]